MDIGTAGPPAARNDFLLSGNSPVRLLLRIGFFLKRKTPLGPALVKGEIGTYVSGRLAEPIIKKRITPFPRGFGGIYAFSAKTLVLISGTKAGTPLAQKPFQGTGATVGSG